MSNVEFDCYQSFSFLVNDNVDRAPLNDIF